MAFLNRQSGSMDQQLSLRAQMNLLWAVSVAKVFLSTIPTTKEKHLLTFIGSLNDTTVGLKCQEDGTWWPHVVCVQKHAYGISVSWVGLAAGGFTSGLIAFVLASIYYRRYLLTFSQVRRRCKQLLISTNRVSKTKDFENFSARIKGFGISRERRVPRFVFSPGKVSYEHATDSRPVEPWIKLKILISWAIQYVLFMYNFKNSKDFILSVFV